MFCGDRVGFCSHRDCSSQALPDGASSGSLGPASLSAASWLGGLHGPYRRLCRGIAGVAGTQADRVQAGGEGIRQCRPGGAAPFAGGVLLPRRDTGRGARLVSALAVGAGAGDRAVPCLIRQFAKLNDVRSSPEIKPLEHPVHVGQQIVPGGGEAVEAARAQGRAPRREGQWRRGRQVRDWATQCKGATRWTPLSATEN